MEYCKDCGWPLEVCKKRQKRADTSWGKLEYFVVKELEMMETVVRHPEPTTYIAACIR